MKASKTFLFVFLIMMSLCVVNTQPVKSQYSGTIYIRADGSVDPDTAPISTTDNVTYTLTDNINASIIIERDNIVVDGGGYTLQGLGSGHYGHYGITVTRGVTIKNMKIRGFSAGIIHLPYEETPSSGTISGNTITNNDRGIVLGAKSRSYTISGNYITTNDCSISARARANCGFVCFLKRWRYLPHFPFFSVFKGFPESISRISVSACRHYASSFILVHE